MSTVRGHSLSTSHYIDGKWIKGESYFDVFSPINGEHLSEIAAGSATNVDTAISSAENAFPAWASLGAEGRLPYLQRFASEIGKRKDALCEVESADAGILLSRLRHGIIPRSMLNITWFAEAALELQNKIIETPQAKHHVRYDPAGVCAIINPWNAPLMLTTWKLGPALASGNTCIIKPPEWAPLSSALLLEAAHAAELPPGVLNMVHGSGSPTGALLTSDSRLARISFTGSISTAKDIGKAAAENLVPCSLELGGKSPFIVLEDADVEQAAKTGALMYRNATQVCLAGTRFLVHENVYHDFIEKMKSYVSALVIGDPQLEETEVGPLIHPRQLERVKGYVDRAIGKGAKILWGGESHDAGDLYYTPTMLSNVKQDDEIVQEEVFGPVLVIQKFKSDTEAISLANGTKYGLGGVCFGEQLHAQQIANQVHTGFIWVNSFGIRDLAAPFGGCKSSGIGREGGDWSFDFFCDVKDVVIPKKPFVPSFAQR
ncbi:MAG: aldehyde dehydrogenase family protein [Gammaproteobacteria bacterium]|nr:aldehyde dehydrogenase family protein [Gammaproteobacteria bacterium]